MPTTNASPALALRPTIIQEEIDRYLVDGRDFIDDTLISSLLSEAKNPDAAQVRDIIARSLTIATLLPEDTAALLNVTDPARWEEIFSAAARVKNTVNDNQVVTFAPLHCGNRCVNNCSYCGFRRGNAAVERSVLTFDEIEAEARVLAGQLGHKRLVE